jgi:hypothetical protein
MSTFFWDFVSDRCFLGMTFDPAQLVAEAKVFKFTEGYKLLSPNSFSSFPEIPIRTHPSRPSMTS